MLERFFIMVVKYCWVEIKVCKLDKISDDKNIYLRWNDKISLLEILKGIGISFLLGRYRECLR